MKTHVLSWTLGWIVLLAASSASMAQTGGQAVHKRPLGARLPTYEAPGVPETTEEPTGTLMLRDALALALMHNPNLATFSWEIRAREAAELQAGVWPNPEIGLEYENIGGSGEFEGIDAAEATLALSQLVLLGGKRGKRTEVARLDNVMANWDYETARIETYASTVGAFVNVLAAQERLALTEKIVDVARDVQEAVSTRVRAGGTLALEENRARVAVESSLIEEILAERDLTIARRELAAMWGSNTPEFTRGVGALDTVGGRTPELAGLLERIDQNPHVARWTSEVERRRARVDLIKADRVPDLNIIAGVRHHNILDNFGFLIALSAPIPSWDRKKGAIREAEHLSSQTLPAQRAAATEVGRDIAVAHEVLVGAHEEITRLRDRVLPEAETAATKSGEAYRAGAIQLTDVLDIQRTFFRLRIRYVNALARYHSAIAELEALTGEPFVPSGEMFGGREREQ